MAIEPLSRSRSTRRKSRLRVVLWVFVLTLVASLVAGGLVLLARPQVTVAEDSAALARISVPGLEGRVTSASVESMDGRALATSLRKGKLWPTGRVQVNRRLLVHVTVQRPGWAGWLLGKSVTKTFVLRTPAAQLEQRWLLTPTNGPVSVSFATPVRTVRIGRGSHVRTLRFATPRSSVVVGRVVPGLPRAGASPSARCHGCGSGSSARPRELVPGRQRRAGARRAGARETARRRGADRRSRSPSPCCRCSESACRRSRRASPAAGGRSTRTPSPSAPRASDTRSGAASSCTCRPGCASQQRGFGRSGRRRGTCPSARPCACSSCSRRLATCRSPGSPRPALTRQRLVPKPQRRSTRLPGVSGGAT